MIQRAARADVTAGGTETGRIGRGLVILLGVAAGDAEADADWLAAKCAGLRIFEDPAGRMNLSVKDVAGGALVVSNFTLCADCVHGRRPSFDGAERPERAEPLVRRFVEALIAAGVPTETGRFGADMALSLVNDGPVTLWIDTANAPVRR